MCVFINYDIFDSLRRVKVDVINEPRAGQQPDCIFRFEKTSSNRNENTMALIELIISS